MRLRIFSILTICICFGVVLYFGADLERHKEWGNPIILWVQQYRNPFLDVFMRIGSLIGFELLVLLIPVLSWTSRKNLVLLGLQITHVSMFGLYFVSLLKNYYQEMRPFQSHTGIKGDYSGSIEYSFPSGHTWCSTIVWILIGEFLIEITKTRVLPILLVSLCSLMVGFSRIYFGVHYPHDVIAGLVGAVGTILVHQEIFHIKITKSEKRGLQKLFSATFVMTAIGYVGNFFVFGKEKIATHLGLFGVPGILFGLWLVEEFLEAELTQSHEIVLWKRILVGSLIVGVIFGTVMIISSFIVRTVLSTSGIVWIHFFAPKVFNSLKI